VQDSVECFGAHKTMPVAAEVTRRNLAMARSEFRLLTSAATSEQN
jgi:hypothetical protein